MPQIHPYPCPQLRVEESYELRRYAPSVWAAACAHGVRQEEGIQRAGAELMRYIKGADQLQ